MEIIAQTTLETATALRSGRQNLGASRVEEVLSRFGARAEPLFRRDVDERTATFFSIRGANPKDANRIVEQLSILPEVTSAYVKPSATPPRNLVAKPVATGGFGPRRAAVR